MADRGGPPKHRAQRRWRSRVLPWSPRARGRARTGPGGSLDVDPANRRTVVVALTPAGRELIDRAIVARVDNERRILAALARHQQDDLAAILRTLLLSLGDEASAVGDSSRDLIL